MEAVFNTQLKGHGSGTPKTCIGCEFCFAGPTSLFPFTAPVAKAFKLDNCFGQVQGAGGCYSKSYKNEFKLT